MKINRLFFAFIALLVCAVTVQAAPDSETEWDEETLHRLYTSATEKEDPQAMYLLGTMFDQGFGVSQNYKEAFNWYHRAADREHAEAMNSLGVLYTLGDGVPQDYLEALTWYLKAVKRGSVSAMNNIATFYYHGLGVRRSYDQAAQWFQLAANNGDPKAMNSLGEMYHRGVGVTQSHPVALELFQRSAQQGHAPAMVNLGDMHASGEGVKKDDVQAYALLSAALSLGFPEDARDDVVYQLGMVAARLNPEQLARAQQLAEGISAAVTRRLQSPEPEAQSPEPEAAPSKPIIRSVRDLRPEKDDAAKEAEAGHLVLTSIDRRTRSPGSLAALDRNLHYLDRAHPASGYQVTCPSCATL